MSHNRIVRVHASFRNTTSNTGGKDISNWTYDLANALRKVSDRLGLSYRTAKELNHIIDTLPDRRPAFKCKDFTIGGEQLTFYFQDILKCVQALYGDPDFANDLVFAPEHHYLDSECMCQIYGEMYSGDWWWEVQVRMDILSI